MRFTIGTKVKFLHTGDEGIVRAKLEKGMVSVYLPKDDMEIPVAEEDLIRLGRAATSAPTPAKEGKKKEREKPNPPTAGIENRPNELQSTGIQLAFLPVENREGLTEEFKIILLNDTRYDVVFDIRFWLNYRSETWSEKLPVASYAELGGMIYDDLNEAPEFDISINWITTEGAKGPVKKRLKIKAKSFFKTMRTAPLLNKPVHLYRLFEKPVFDEDKKTENLIEYTRRHTKPAWKPNDAFRLIDTLNSSDLAHFPLEIDLHIDQLRDDWEKMNNAEILAVQLTTFDAYLDQAIRVGVPSVFIIHGVGKGRLRNEIATRLLNNPDVKTFKNEYHHKYGWGATEVIF